MSNSNSLKRRDRPANLVRYDFTAGTGSDAFTMTLQNGSFSATFFPKLGDDFPVLAFTQKVRGVPPARLPLHEAFRVKMEIDGNEYPAIVNVYTTNAVTTYVVKDEMPIIAYLFDEKGEVLTTAEFPHQRSVLDALHALSCKRSFQTSAKQLPATSFRTVTGKPDLEAMTQIWSATVSAPGLPVFQVGGQVSDLRKAGFKDVDNFQNFKNGWTLQKAIEGKVFDLVFIEDAHGVFYTLFHIDGALISASTSKFGLDGAMYDAGCSMANYLIYN